MKWICTIAGIFIALYLVLFSPWPRFTTSVANQILAIPEATDDIIFHTLVKGLTVFVIYVLLPALGGIIGYGIGSLLVRKFD